MSLPNPIFKRWTHSREEDEGDIQVYRPSDYPFPPARGREGLEFRPNGEFISYPIGASDRTIGVPGEWISTESNRVRIQFSDPTRTPLQLMILDCSDQMLQIKKL